MGPQLVHLKVECGEKEEVSAASGVSTCSVCFCCVCVTAVSCKLIDSLQQTQFVARISEIPAQVEDERKRVSSSNLIAKERVSINGRIMDTNRLFYTSLSSLKFKISAFLRDRIMKFVTA